MPSLGGGFGVGSWVGADTAVTEPSVDNEKARGIFVSLYPPGKLYDFNNPDAELYKFTLALGEAIKLFGFDVIDRLFVEFNQGRCVEKLPDWEAALGIVPGTGFASANRTTAQRQASVVAKLRESGACTPANIRAVLGPLLGYTDPSTLEILETSRADLTALHTYTDTTGSVALGASSSVNRLIPVSDSGTIVGGVQVFCTVATTPLTDLTITLTAPDGTAKAWTLSDRVLGTDFILYSPSDFLNATIAGIWTLKITNNGATAGTWSAGSVFVEGQGIDGLGGDIFSWGFYADPVLVNSPDYRAALGTVVRVNPAHAQGFLILSEDPYPDETSGVHASIPNQCIPV